MAIEKILMPQLGESVTEGTITKWFVSVGERVQKYDPLAEVLTDKVTAEIPSSFSGVIKELVAKENETLDVGSVICTIETEEVKDKVIEQTPKEEIAVVNVSYGKNKTRYSPAVLKLSQEHGIDLTQVQGTGRGGRITRKDILKFIEEQKTNMQPEERKVPKEKERAMPSRPPLQNEISQFKTEQQTVSPLDQTIPVTPLRKAIASNMVRSKQEIPHAWMMVEADVTNLVAYRDRIKDSFREKEGFNLTYFAFFVKAVAQALKEFPMLNSEWQGDKIVQRKEINLSIAVASEHALYVPVIKNADEKSIKGIAREIQDLAQKARTGTLSIQDTQGGTFTVNNTGSFGSVQSMGIINHPQAAILQVETIVKKPVVIDNGIFVRDMVNLCLSLDHRVLDGLICGKFLKRLKEILENISEENTPIY